MTAQELLAKLVGLTSMTPGALVTAIRREDGHLMKVVDLEVERHEGSGHTLWIKVDDY
jgi:hypothetical protein